MGVNYIRAACMRKDHVALSFLLDFPMPLARTSQGVDFWVKSDHPETPVHLLLTVLEKIF